MATTDMAGYATTFWGARDGAPADIRAMAQTRDGWLWLGTSSGLFRFDGQSFAAHDLVPARFDGRRLVSDMAALPDGQLLVVYDRARVMRLAADGVTASHPEGLPDHDVDGLLFEQGGRIFAVAGKALFTLEGDRWKACDPTEWTLPKGDIDGGTLDASGALVVNTASGVYRLVPGAKVFEHVDGIDASPGRHLFSAADGRMWRTEKRGFELLPGLEAGTSAMGSGSSVFANDGRGGFWSMLQGCPSLCLRREGVDPGQEAMARPDIARFPTGRDGLTTMTLLSDRAGNVWAGGKEGLVRFHPVAARRVALGYDAYYFAVMPLDDGTVLVGAESNSQTDALVRFGPTGRVVLADEIHTHAMARWTNGRVLHVGRAGPLHLVDGDRLVRWADRPGKADDALTLAALPAGSDRAWVSLQDQGLFLVTPRAWTPVGAMQGFPPLAPSVGAVDDGGRAWFGYADGKVRKVENDRVEDGGVLETGIGSVSAVLPGTPLVVGGDDGIAWFDGKAFHPLVLRFPDALKGVTGLARTPDGALWAYGRAGLVRIDARALRATMEAREREAGFRIATENDGMSGGAQQSRGFGSLNVDAKGMLWAAGSVGLVTIDPAAVKPPAPVRPVILSMTNGRHDALPTQGATLAPDDATLEVAFTALSLDEPRYIQLRYRLRGDDATWHDADGTRTVTFNRLPPGTYQFELQARNTEGDWSPGVVSQAIVRVPAFTETWLFRCLIGVACLLVLYGLYELRVRALRHRHMERTNAKLAERDRIASELHDSILQGVQAVALRLSAWEIDANVPEAMRARVTALSLQMKGIVLEGRARVVSLRSIGQGGMVLSDALRLIGEDHADDSGIAFEIEVVGGEFELPDAIRVPVLDILREAIHNAFLHAQGKTVNVTLEFSTTRFHARVVDDGRGLPADVRDAGRRPGHWGLVIMRERAEGIGARFDIASDPSGTVVSLAVTVPGEKSASGQRRPVA